MNISRTTIQLRRIFPVNIGTILNSFEYRIATQGIIERRMSDKLEMEITSKAEDLMWNAEETHLSTFFSEKKEDVLLADVSVAELGLPDQSAFGDILAEAVGRTVTHDGKQYALAKALPEDLLMFRLVYLD
ncbi:MAG: hypothetical protein EXS46_01730 [Candidatus Taylorbacteria bacterium]|nr:hypothetical protein [Candidatus Taylorbacteria bacterium]